MVISQPPGNPSYYYRASPTLPQLLWMLSRDTLCSIHAIANIRVTHRNGAISVFLIMNRSTEGSSADCSLFILSLHALALHLAVKNITSNLSVWRFEHVGLTYSCHFLQNAVSRTGNSFVTQPIIIKWNISNIWHKSSTKHKEVRPDWNDKNDNVKLRALVSHGRFYQWSGHIFKEIFDHAKRFRLWIVLF